MKKILLLLLISFIAKPDYSSAGLSYGTIDGDIDLLSLSYENVSSKFAVTGVVANADAGAADATLTEVMLDYGFGNFNEGSWFVGIEHARASGGGEQPRLGVGRGTRSQASTGSDHVSATRMGPA